MINVEFLMAARQRLVYAGQKSLSGAIIDKPDRDELAVILDKAHEKLRGSPDRAAIDAIEILVAERVDAGETLPISNQEGYGAARWIGQLALAELPNPMPRTFVLYLAKALLDDGKYNTMTAALNDILATKTFT